MRKSYVNTHVSKCGKIRVLYSILQCLIFDMLKGRKAQMTEPALTATQMLDVPDDSAAAVKSELDPANSTDCYLETEQPVSSDFNQDGT